MVPVAGELVVAAGGQAQEVEEILIRIQPLAAKPLVGRQQLQLFAYSALLPGRSVDEKHAAVEVAMLGREAEPLVVQVSSDQSIGGSGEGVLADVLLQQRLKRVLHQQVTVQIQEPLVLIRQVIRQQQSAQSRRGNVRH